MADAQVDPGLLQLLLALTGQSNNNADAATLNAQRQWMTPTLNGWSGDVLDVAGMHAPFDRTDMNAAYTEMLSTPGAGKVSDAQAWKMQIDYIAVMERAFRTRHSTRIRAVAHNTARKAGHGNARGLFLNTVLGYAQRLAGGNNDGNV